MTPELLKEVPLMDGLMQTTIPQERITRDALRDLFFINFLSGSVYDSEAAIRSAACEVGLTFPHPLFLVLIARTEHWGSAFAKGEVDLRECHFILRNAFGKRFPRNLSSFQCAGRNDCYHQSGCPAGVRH